MEGIDIPGVKYGDIHVMKNEKIPCYKKLFEIREEGEEVDKEKYENEEMVKRNSGFTTKVLFLQDILLYSISFGVQNKFKSQEISRDWLFKKNVELLERYESSRGASIDDSSKNINTRIDDIDERVKRALSHLDYLELISSSKITLPNKEKTEEYQFTNFGRFVALLIESDRQKTDKPASNINIKEVHRQWNNIYFDLTQKSSIDLFCNIFNEKAIEENRFEIVLKKYKKIIHNSNSNSRIQLFEEFSRIMFSEIGPKYFGDDIDQETNKILFSIFKKALDEFALKDRQKYEMYLFNLKRHIENLQIFKPDFDDFEINKFIYFLNKNNVIVKGYCNTCKYYQTISISPIESAIEFMSLKPEKVAKCRRCSNGDLDLS